MRVCAALTHIVGALAFADFDGGDAGGGDFPFDHGDELDALLQRTETTPRAEKMKQAHRKGAQSLLSFTGDSDNKKNISSHRHHHRARSSFGEALEWGSSAISHSLESIAEGVQARVVAVEGNSLRIEAI